MSDYTEYHNLWFAMGTEWQLQLFSSQPRTDLRAVAEAVVEEVERVEQQLSFYRPTSDLRSLNAGAAIRPTPVDPRLFRLLETTKRISNATEGAFDPTIGPLLRCWGFVGSSGAMPRTDEIERCRSIAGLNHVTLDAQSFLVSFDCVGVELEFGAIGKGYAIDRAVDILRDEQEISSALLHGGGSTFYGLGAPPGANAWHIAIQRPNALHGESAHAVSLRDRAVSVSAPHGKWFEHEGKRYGHVLDPRTGCPAAGSVLAAVATSSATESDALSTALLVLGEPGIDRIREYCPDAFLLLQTHERADVIHTDQDRLP